MLKQGECLLVQLLDTDEYDRIGLIGQNGTGKTTLIRILLGEIVVTGCAIDHYGTFSYIPQREEHGYILGQSEAEFDVVIAGKLGVTMDAREYYSGGEETRRKITESLSGQVHGIFADEPTSHLDRDGVNFLVGQLYAYQGAILLVSHDREFLDLVVNKIWELKDGKITEYYGNFSDYEHQKLEER